MRRSWVLGFTFLAACGDTYITYVNSTGAADANVSDAGPPDEASAVLDAAADAVLAETGSDATADGSLSDASADDGATKDAAFLDGATDASVTVKDANSDVTVVSDGSASDANVATDATKSDVVFVFDSGTQVDASVPDACAQTAVEAKPIGIDLYVVLDKSGSMHGPVSTWQQAKGDCNVGQTVNSKWCKSINALANYFSSTSATGNRAALNFFAGTFTGSQCGGTLYSSPVVPLTGFVPLPDSTSFTSAMNAEVPGGETPTEAALRGMVLYTGASWTYTAGRQRVGVLVTDGYPTSCETSATKLAAIADAHYVATGVQTFMVGMDGADFSHLETMAAGGHAAMHAKNVGALTNACGNGKSTCQSWNIGDGSNNALSVALEQIQYEAAACSFAMPQTDAGIIDPKAVTVEYLQGGTTTKTLSRVNDATACGTSGGFYYDNNASPTMIKLCTTTCDLVRADGKAKVQVKLGCEGS